MAEQAALDPLLVPPRSLLGRLPGPVWGIDSQWTRTSVAVLTPEDWWAATASMPTVQPLGRRMLHAVSALEELWYSARAFGEPVAVAVEGLSPHGMRGNKDRQLQMLGLVHFSLWRAAQRSAEEVQPNSWKAAALGKGHGHAKPAEYVRWAQVACGWVPGPTRPDDEAAALGVATWQALKVLAG